MFMIFMTMSMMLVTMMMIMIMMMIENSEMAENYLLL